MKYWVQQQAAAGNWVDSIGCESKERALGYAEDMATEETICGKGRYRVIERTDVVITKTTQPAPKTNDPKMVKALKAVDKIFANLSESTFIDLAGQRALTELKEYRVDMAADIAGEF